MKERLSDNWIILIGTCLISVFIAMIITFVFKMENYNCDSIGEKMGFESSFSHIQGCMIKVGGHFIPAENYKVVHTV